MVASRLNIGALVGSLIVFAVSVFLDSTIENRARGGGGWNAASLVGPGVQAVLAVVSLVGLLLSLRSRQIPEPAIVTLIVLLVSGLVVDAGVAGYCRYSPVTCL